MIAKLLEQRADVVQRRELALQQMAELDQKLEQIDRELAEARDLIFQGELDQESD